jgi:hypothetical protein
VVAASAGAGDLQEVHLFPVVDADTTKLAESVLVKLFNAQVAEVRLGNRLSQGWHPHLLSLDDTRQRDNGAPRGSLGGEVEVM